VTRFWSGAKTTKLIRNEPSEAGGAFNLEEVGGVPRGPVEKHWENAILSRGNAAARVGDDEMKSRAIYLACYFQMRVGHTMRRRKCRKLCSCFFRGHQQRCKRGLAV
jgi:hypothetical protein